MPMTATMSNKSILMRFVTDVTDLKGPCHKNNGINLYNTRIYFSWSWIVTDVTMLHGPVSHLEGA